MTRLRVDPDAGQKVRRALGLESGDDVRISYFGGPGDAVGTFNHWRSGNDDPRVPVITYSAMFYDLVKALGARAQIITRFAPPETPDPQFRFDTIAPRTRRGRIGWRLDQAATIREIAGIVDNFEPHIVLVSTDLPPFGWRRLKRGRKFVLSAHNTFWPMGRPPSGPKASFKNWLLKRYAQPIDAAVCTSAECMRQVYEITRGRVEGRVEIPQLVLRHDQESRTKLKDLLFLGRIEENKGVFMLLEAFLELKRSYPELTLTFAGSGSAEVRLRGAITEASISGLTFRGMLDSEGVHHAIAATDLLVCPTTSHFNEGLALVGLEAAAHGIPSLLSSIVPAADILGNGCVIFAVDDTAALRMELERLIRDEEAYAKLQENLEIVLPQLYDRAESWGSQLCRVLTEI